MKNFLLDTNILINYLNGMPPFVNFLNSLPKEQMVISVISRIELLSYPKLTPKELTDLNDFIFIFRILTISDTSADMAARVRRAYKLRLPDAIIAATAIQYDAILVSNDRDFQQVRELELKHI